MPFNRIKCSLRNGNPPILPAFTFTNGDNPVLEIHVPNFQPSQFGPANTGRMVDLNNGSVPQFHPAVDSGLSMRPGITPGVIKMAATYGTVAIDRSHSPAASAGE